MSIFVGSGVALVTPFDENNKVNYDKLKELVEFHIENDTDALVVVGTTGEASTLPDEEHISVVKYCVEAAAGRITVVAGSGSNDTAHAVKLSIMAEKAGADGLLVVTPYYNKTNRSGLIKHYTTIADSVNIPIILYNVPGRTGMSIPADVVAELSKNEKIVGLKEASGDISYVGEVARLCGEDFAIYSGNDDIIVPVMSLGGKGVISVLANIMPKETHDMVMSYIEGDVKKSRDMQLKYNDLVHTLFIETNPIPVKMAMNLLGMNAGGLRLPLDEMSEANTKILAEKLQNIGLEVKL